MTETVLYSPGVEDPQIQTPPVSQETDVYFKVHCPALGKEVVMYKTTWFGHIIHPVTGHRIMSSKQELVKRAVGSITTGQTFFKFSDCPEDTWFFDFPCVDFQKLNDFLRIGFKKLAGGEIIFSTAFPVKRGVMRYEP